MKPRSFMLIAGEASGDLLAAELVVALRDVLAGIEASPTEDYQPLHASIDPRFFGAGGPRMAAAGVELAFDLTEHSVVGITDVVRNYLKFRRLFHELYRLAIAREPDVIVCVDFSGFNRRFAHAIKRYTSSRQDWFHDWRPRLVQYVSPQVWASREDRVYQIASDYDLLLSIFPFEKPWYASRAPALRVEYVGHPILDRHETLEGDGSKGSIQRDPGSSSVLLLPGSRAGELRRHLPVLLGALKILRGTLPKLRTRMVLPDEMLLRQAQGYALPDGLETQVGGLSEALHTTDIAIASTGTVTMECAYFGVPTVALYKTSWSNYQIAKRLVKVRYLAMPNLLADEEIFPEFIQGSATAENIGRAALELLQNPERQAAVKAKLAEITASLGQPGASQRAAAAVAQEVIRSA